MNLIEVDSRKILMACGVRVYQAHLATNADEVECIARGIDDTVVIKAEIGLGSRGKHGGVKICKPDEAYALAKVMFSSEVRGIKVKRCLVAKAVDIAKEFYFSISIDRTSRLPVIMVSKVGGVEIEETAKTNPEKLLRLQISPSVGLQKIDIETLRDFLSISNELHDEFTSLVNSLYDGFWKYNTTLIEINPLAIDETGHLIAVDAKIVLDDYAATDVVKEFSIEDTRTQLEIEAGIKGLSFVELDGDVACIVNGAGLAMATVDSISHLGMKPANLLDVGGSSSPDKMKNAIEILTRQNHRLKAIFVNIFGGITRCDDVATGLIDATKNLRIPLVVRLSGTASNEAKKMLADIGINCFSDMKDGLLHLQELCK